MTPVVARTGLTPASRRFNFLSFGRCFHRIFSSGCAFTFTTKKSRLGISAQVFKNGVCTTPHAPATVLPTSRRAELYRALQRPVLDVKASNIGFDSPCYTETMKFYMEPDSVGDASSSATH
jgi:hypothetical protein